MSTGESNLDGVLVGLAEVGEKTARWVVAAVDFIEEVDALDIDIVVLGTDYVRVVLKLLDIDYGDLRLAGVIVNCFGRFDVTGEGLSAIDGVYRQPPAGELALCLNEQVDSIHDEIEFWDDDPALEIIGEKVCVVVGQCGLAAALCVPDDSFSNTGIEFPFNGFGGEELWIAHDMFAHAIRLVYIG